MVNITKPKSRPIICTIAGEAGMGKTTLANTFPSPIFIRAEDGLNSISENEMPDAFDLLTDPEMLWDQIKYLLNKDHNYKTLVVDSISELDQVFTDHILKHDKADSINKACGGYGAGKQVLNGMHGRLRKGAGMLNQIKGMNVVFLSHADTVTIEPPDSEPYTKYMLKITKGCDGHYQNNVDLVGHLKLETFLKGSREERKKAVSTGDILLVCHSDAAQLSKNRFGITEPLPVPNGRNPLIDIVPSLKRQNETPARQTVPTATEDK